MKKLIFFLLLLIISVPAFAGVQDGLVAWWTLDNQDSLTSTTVLDKSGNGNTGNLNSMTQAGNSITGVRQQGLSFNGSSQYIVDTQVINAGFATVSCWIKISAYPASKGHIIGFMNGIGSGTKDKNLSVDANGKVHFYVYDGTTKITPDPSVTVPLNKWTHVAGTTNNSFTIAYQDGVEIARVATNTSFAGYSVPNVFLSGSTSDTAWSGQWLAGQYDDARIYNRSLSAQEILDLYRPGAILRNAKINQ